MNRAGFTTVEVIIASALIVVLVTGAAVGMKQINLLNQFASTRTSQTEMHSQVYEALSDSGACATNLGKGTADVPIFSALNDTPFPIAQVSQNLSGAPIVVLKNNDLKDGIRYELKMRLLPPVSGQPFNLGLGRAVDTVRYRAELQMIGKREKLTEQGGGQTWIRNSIPLSVEIDASNHHLVSCTTNFEDMDERLAGGTHTVRECYAIDGTPMLTPDGLICRVPYRTLNTNKWGNAPGQDGAIPSCTLVAGGGWSDAAPFPNYNATTARDAVAQGCGGAVYFHSPWHYFSRSDHTNEYDGKNVKKGGSQVLQIAASGASFALAAFIGNALLGPLGVVIVFIIFSKCRTEPARLYSQVIAVGCK